METNYELHHDAAGSRYYFQLPDAQAEIVYIDTPDAVILTHTHVPEQYGGQGIAGRLTQAVLEALNAEQKKIVPQCSYIARYVERHPQWQTMLK